MQTLHFRYWIAICLSVLFVSSVPRTAASGTDSTIDETKPPLQEALTKSYFDLFQLTERTQYTEAEINEIRNGLEKAEEICVNRFKKQAEQYKKEIEQIEKQLKDGGTKISKAQREEMHCKIVDLRARQNQAEMLAKHAIPIAYQNRNAKLNLAEQWPSKFREISKQLEDGTYRDRRWGNVEDIGFREIESGQEKDIKDGEQAIREMKTQGLMPKEVDNREVTDYVKGIAQRIASHSDLKIPLKVTVLDSKEINAFALPGGYLFVERGLLEAADDEAEIAGVLGHEMSHVVVRHGHKLMLRAEITNIFLQGAQIAAIIFTGGTAGIGTYYAIQYGYYGLGFLLNLNLLGVSRDFELQADQLGIQYTWASGYDPTGFIRFFDKMATTQGYVEGASWFYDHPPFYERMVEAEREITFLPKKEELVYQTSQFESMKKALAKVTTKAKVEEGKKPSLLGTDEKACPQPKKQEYEAGQSIDVICAGK
jgi:hypothetical protein